ncbi:MAG: VIT1/CCC1 transporter family protein [Sulfobacillus thermotolerans]|nr:VIT1/CCC1 transporter family protein [Sulfobacillus thermotolerans]
MTENAVPHARTEVVRHSPAARSIREVVFGVNDGLVSITGLVVGVTASNMSSHQILIAAIAAVVAATVAMALGQYLATVAQNEYFLAERSREMREVHEVPHEEIAEVEGIYKAQGFTQEQVEMLTKHITSDKDRWVDFMMKEELGIMLESMDHPWRSALIMAGAVILGSLPPVLPYVIIANPHTALIWAMGLAVTTAFGLGVLKAVVGKTSWLKGGAQFLLVTAIAIAVGIFAGHGLADLLA